MSFCSCLLVDELMLSSFHKSVSISNVDFLISIINVLNFDSELLLLLSFALSFAKRGKKERIKRLFIFLFIKTFSRFKLLTSKNSLNIA
jgi:NADH:ubiquinone oxidoreductase subunit 3 (subunit A)